MLPDWLTMTTSPCCFAGACPDDLNECANQGCGCLCHDIGCPECKHPGENFDCWLCFGRATITRYIDGHGYEIPAALHVH